MWWPWQRKERPRHDPSLLSDTGPATVYLSRTGAWLTTPDRARWGDLVDPLSEPTQPLPTVRKLRVPPWLPPNTPR